jgi:hypothetical protein
MASGLTSPSGDELERLRQQYDRLCDLMTRAAESDPAAAERVLIELQSLSERILLLQTARADMPDTPVAPVPAPPIPAPPDAPAEAPGAAVPETPGAPQAAAEASLASTLSPGEPPPPDRAAVPAQRPEATPARIVAFRVTPSVGSRAAAGDAAPKPASWRIDAPPPDLGPSNPGAPDQGTPDEPQLDLPAGMPAPAAPPQTVPAIAPRPAAQQKPATAVKPAAASSRAQPKPALAPGSGPAIPPPAAPPTGAPGNATLFTSAIRQWLERHRNGSDGGAAAPAPAVQAVDGEVAPPAATRAEMPGGTTPTPQMPATGEGETGRESSPAFSRVVAAVEQQAAQIERILELCEAHQLALEQLEARLEARIEARIDATRQAPPAAADPELPELRAAVEEQRQRITALAKTIHNLAQWLATQRAAPGR